MSDLDKKYPLRLDTRINFKNLIPHFYISDNQTNDFYIKLTNDNKPVEVEDIIVVIAVINPNGNINSSFLDTKTEKGLIYCNLPNELKNVVGVYKARIMCISGEERIVSNTFEYKVDTDEFQLIDEITEDSEEMIVLSQMLSRLSNMEIELQANETERTANENERIANEAERIENENLRQQAEDNRNTTEEARVVAESNRISNESERVLGEQTRVENEQNRISAENERISNENIRKENENRRLEKENNNIQAELNRVQAESNRVQAELKREQSESNRKNSENARNDNEDIRKQNELKRQSNENTRITNENERIANENERAKVNANRQQAEQTRVTNERNRKEAETARVSAERNRANNESVRISNENIRKNNEEKRKEEFKAKIIEIDNALASLETADGGYPKFINDIILAYIDKDNILERSEIQQLITNASTYVITCPAGEKNISSDEMDSRIKDLARVLSNTSVELGKTIYVSGTVFSDFAISFNISASSSLVVILFYKTFQSCMIYCQLSENGDSYAQLSEISLTNSTASPVATSGSYNDLTDRPLKVLPTGMTAVDYYNLEIGIYKASGTTYFEYTENCNYYNGVSHFEIFENEIISIEQQYNLVNLSNGKYCWLDETGKITDIGNTSEAWTGELATVATSGSYNDLTDKPIIPTAYNLPVANQNTLGGIKVGAGLSITADGILSATGGGTADSVNWENVVGKPTFATVATTGSYNDLINKPTIPEAGIPSLVGSNENQVKIWELEDGVYNLSGILKYRYDYYSTETGGTLEGWQIEGLYIIYNAGDDPDNEGRTIKICKNLKYNFYFKYSLLNGTIESSRYDPEYIKEDNSNPIGEEEAITVLPNNLTAVDYYNLPVGIYRVTADSFFDATTNCELRNGLTNDILAFPNGSLISCEGQGLIINLSYSVYFILNDTGEVNMAGSTNNAWTGELATVATSGDYNDLTDKPTIPHYNETLMFEISGETDYGNFYANRYFNISALSLDETKSYVGKHKPIMDFPDELIHEFVYNKEANALMDEMNSVYIYNHKSYNGTNFIEDENSAVLTYDIKPMAISSGYNGYFRLYEIEKLELNNNCLSDDVSIKNSLTVGSRIGDIGKYSVAEGNENTASGGCSHAEGISTTASSNYSHAEGDNTTANGVASHAEGVNTTASGDFSHAEGGNTTASGDFSHAEGGNTIASTDYSHAEGYYTIASTDFQHVQGRFNIEDTGRIYAHIVGNGVSDTERRNAHTLDWNGNAWYQGKLSQDGTPAEDKDLATKKYVDDSIATVNADTIDNLHIWTGTQSQYDALGTKDSNTIYLIKEG